MSRPNTCEGSLRIGKSNPLPALPDSRSVIALLEAALPELPERAPWNPLRSFEKFCTRLEGLPFS